MTDMTPKKKANPPADWRERFLTALRREGVVSYAARSAKVSRQHVYLVREAEKEFAAAWDDAIEEATDGMEREAIRRATKGVKRHKRYFFFGEEIAHDVITEYSDSLLMFMLKANRPEKYRERYDHSIHSPGSDALKVEGFNAMLDQAYGESDTDGEDDGDGTDDADDNAPA